VSFEAVAGRYAQALFQLGTEQGNLPALAAEIQRMADVYSSSADLRGVIDNPLVEEKSRVAILNEIAQRLSLGPVARNTVGLLADRKRLAILPYVARELAKLSDEKGGLVRATVTSASPLSETYFSRLKEQLEKSTGKKVQLEQKVDPTLLGGIVTRIGDKVIDGSLKSRLAALRESLLAT
jgi:F-type H+-transporting ATPase subunit delta